MDGINTNDGHAILRPASWHNAHPMQTDPSQRLRLNGVPGSATLPQPDAEAQAASAALCQLIAGEIQRAGGWLPFSRYMELALYAPGLGYYSGGAQKFGAAGDFITAPELTPLFARTLARPVIEMLRQTQPYILEAGAGSGMLAAELLLTLEREGQLPERYFILELSGELRARQQATLAQRAPHLLTRVSWLDGLPQHFAGVVLGNEVLDAMPVALVEWYGDGRICERGVSRDAAGQFVWASRPAQGALLAAARRLEVPAMLTAEGLVDAQEYGQDGQNETEQPVHVSEINLAAAAWLAGWSDLLEQGAVLLIDYGCSRQEYYAPQRHQGTLRCHYRHHVHDDPLWWPGLNDITAHVDFSAMADAAFEAGLEVLGYTNQGRFLLNCGITAELARIPNDGGKAYLSAARAVEKLILPHEMGELFKVLACGRGVTQLMGFTPGDRLHTL